MGSTQMLLANLFSEKTNKAVLQAVCLRGSGTAGPEAGKGEP